MSTDQRSTPLSKEGLLEAAPGFDPCGACGGTMRKLTEGDAQRWLWMIAEALADGQPALRILDELVWPVEMHARSYRDEDCWYHTKPQKKLAPSRGFHLYRLWDSNGRLLYVGVSRCLRRRLATHRRTWGALIDDVTWEEHADAASMLAAETLAITTEHPALNLAKT